MSIWAEDSDCVTGPWEIFTGLRYDLVLKTSEDQLQIRPNGQKSALYLSEYHRQRLLESAKHFGWSTYVDHVCLSNTNAWEEYLEEAVQEYQAKNVSQGITIETPLKVRIAIINANILEECRKSKSSLISGASQKLQQYVRNIQADSEAVLTGLRIIISPVPEQLLSQLFPSSLNMSSAARQSLTHHFLVVVDTAPTTSSSSTYLKTFPRTVYDNATSRMIIALAKLASVDDDGDDRNKNTALGSHTTPTNGHVEKASTKTTQVKHEMKEVMLYTEAGSSSSSSITEGSFTNVYFHRNGQWVTPPVGAAHNGGLPGIARRWALEHGLCIEQVVLRQDVKLNEEIWLSNGVRGFVPGTVVSI